MSKSFLSAILACSFAGSSAFAVEPSDFEGLELWLKADTGVETADNLPPANEQYVAYWQDQSPNGYLLSRVGNRNH